MTETILLIAETEAPRIDAYLATNTEFSRSKLQKLIKEGAVEQNGKPCKANSEVKTGDVIRLHVPEESDDQLPEPENIPLDVVYEDEDLASTRFCTGSGRFPERAEERGRGSCTVSTG